MAYCKAIRNYTGINRFFIAENFQKISDDINYINHKSKARSVETFDFTSLYTFIFHGNLKSNLNWFVEVAYNGAIRHGQKYLSVYSKSANGLLNTGKLVVHLIKKALKRFKTF